MMRGLEHLLQGEAGTTGPVQPQEVMTERGTSFVSFKYLQGKDQEDRARLFLVVPSNRRRGSGQKGMHGKFHLNMGKNFTVQVTMDWSRLPRAAVESPLLKVFQNCLDAILCIQDDSA